MVVGCIWLAATLWRIARAQAHPADRLAPEAQGTPGSDERTHTAAGPSGDQRGQRG